MPTKNWATFESIKYLLPKQSKHFSTSEGFNSSIENIRTKNRDFIGWANQIGAES
jgi:hypothetical protein